jgi:DMSO/TMAO reductase YedYZ molybdopterin-dependent catalytic subunit
MVGLLAVLWLSTPDFAVAQQAPAAGSGVLKVTGEVRTPLSLSPDELKAMPRKRVEVKDEDGRTVAYDGVLVGEILKRAGAKLGSDMRGNAVATYVVASANDGYQVLFSLAELDPAFTGSEVIVADTSDGKPLFAYQGPLRIVAPRDTRPARSIRMLERLEVVQLKK